jgi:nicotinamidase-related amidase
MKNKALIIIDIQNDYFEGGANELSGSAQAAIKAREILNYFRSNNLPVFHVQHLSMRPGSTFFIPNSKGAEIHEYVKPIKNEHVVLKNFPNSFRNTDLLEHLQLLKIDELVICGMMTQMCVDATVRAAKDLGFDITVISDACATKDLEIQGKKVLAEHVQNAFLAGLSYFYASVKTAQEYLG